MAPRPFGGTSLGPTGDRDASPRPSWWFGGGSSTSLLVSWIRVVVVVISIDAVSCLVVMAYCKRGDTVYSSFSSSGTASPMGSTTWLLVEVVVLLVLVSDGCCSTTTDVRLRVDRRVGMGGGRVPLPLGRFVRREDENVVRRRSGSGVLLVGLLNKPNASSRALFRSMLRNRNNS
jgi:hypothetical protein